MNLKFRDNAIDVSRIAVRLGAAGYWMPTPRTLFDEHMDAVVRTFQEDHGLTPDGIVGTNTVDMLDLVNRVGYRYITPDHQLVVQQTAREEKMQRVLDLAIKSFGGRGIVYGPGVQHKKDGQWVVANGWGKGAQPMSRAVKEGFTQPYTNGWVCSTCVALVMGYWLNMNGFYTWRTGRWQEYILRYPVGGQEHKGKVHSGYAEYCEPVFTHRWVKDRDLFLRCYGLAHLLGHVNIIEYPSHIVFLLKVDDEFQLYDPRTGDPCRRGLYRFGADGWSTKRNGVTYYRAQRTTFRWVPPTERLTTNRARIYRVREIGLDGRPEDGPLAGRVTWPFVLAGHEYQPGIPELAKGV